MSEGGGLRELHQPARTRLTVSDPELAGPVLSRLVAALGARADLPLDRLDDAVLVADTLAVHALRQVADGRLSVAVDVATRDLAFRVGPLRQGGAHAVIAASSLPGAGSILETLADEVGVRRRPGGEEELLLRVRYTESGAAPLGPA